MNLHDEYPEISHDLYCKELEQEFGKHYQCTPEREILNYSQILKENETVSTNYERLKSWQWLYGQCPEFKYTIDKKFDWGMT